MQYTIAIFPPNVSRKIPTRATPRFAFCFCVDLETWRGTSDPNEVSCAGLFRKKIAFFTSFNLCWCHCHIFCGLKAIGIFPSSAKHLSYTYIYLYFFHYRVWMELYVDRLAFRGMTWTLGFKTNIGKINTRHMDVARLSNSSTSHFEFWHFPNVFISGGGGVSICRIPCWLVFLASIQSPRLHVSRPLFFPTPTRKSRWRVFLTWIFG